jgi:2,3-bisphosphoglycerate-independent phosphoglycerate mutase
VKEHRFLLVLRGNNLSGHLHETDPQQIGKKPLPPKALEASAEHTVKLVNEFLDQARELLADHHPANMVLLRGFSQKPQWPTIQEVFGLQAAGVASYPMYRGLAKLIGMDILDTGETLDDRIEVIKNHWDTYDFFFLHEKHTDSSGEDGDFNRKVSVIERVDEHIPKLRALQPDVLVITGDHSTPAVLQYHSWHPVPVLLWSHYCRPDAVQAFNETACVTGGLGPLFPAEDLLPLAMANAQRLEKFGA